jgi:hypothetical protein
MSSALGETCLDVIFYLLQHCPDALRRGVGNATVPTVSVGAVAAHDSTNDSQQGNDGLAAEGSPVRKKAKASC